MCVLFHLLLFVVSTHTVMLIKAISVQLRPLATVRLGAGVCRAFSSSPVWPPVPTPHTPHPHFILLSATCLIHSPPSLLLTLEKPFWPSELLSVGTSARPGEPVLSYVYHLA